MKLIKSSLLLTLSLVSFSVLSVEIIPLVGLRGGGEFIDDATNKAHTLNQSEAYGLIFSFDDKGKNKYEIYYSHQSTELDSITTDVALIQNTDTTIPITIDYLHFGGTVPVSDDKNLQTFVSGGLGLTYLSPDFPDTQSDLRASFSIGFGLKWPVTDKVSLRLETRGLATLFNSNSAVFCNGGCRLQVNGGLLFQAEVFAGLGFKF
jgi:opacity protein-like surface antigen